MLSPKKRKEFFDAVDSLKRFKRAEVTDRKNRTLIDKLYTDLLPENQVFNMCFSGNTTFLVGRKGTGKSTIILKLENEYRKDNNYLSCYIDTKTVFESSKSEYKKLDYLNDKIPEGALEQYLVERSFIQEVLKSIGYELDKRADNFFAKFSDAIGIGSKAKVKKKISSLLSRVSNNDILSSIEVPVVTELAVKIQTGNESEVSKAVKNKGAASLSIEKNGSINAGLSGERDSTSSSRSKENEIWEKSFSSTLLKVFQIKNFIDEIEVILKTLKIKKLIVFLDDFSEVDEQTIKNFVDVVLAPLNNWSNEFVCFKVAAYPNRVYYGNIDPGKVDVVELDFYNLYSNYDKATMESLSVNFTKRILENRVNYFCSGLIADYFDVNSNVSLEEYYELIFKVSMNVPRIIGYILFYCHQTHVSQGKLINRLAIENAASNYYDKIVSKYFDIATNSLMSFDEKVSELQQKELLDLIMDKLKQVKKQIVTSELTGDIYKADSKNPFCSHFFFQPNLEHFVRSLELNFFITKYNEMSDRDGVKISVYGLNYGLAKQQNLRWGKPDGTKYRKYFIGRPFDFNKIIEDFLKGSKKIVCLNPSCAKVYPYEQLEFLKFAKMKCVDCHCPVELKSISDNIADELGKIDKAKLLPKLDLSILHELNKDAGEMFARDIAEELDASSKLIAKRAEKMDKNLSLIHRDRSGILIKYSITESAKEMYFHN
ncbi:hypothetical protein JY479_06085 [Serratia marcescens]|nr:hypothetical protein [Serratia marcescens]